MASSPAPPESGLTPASIPRFSSPSGSRPRHSLNSSFSFGPQSLVDSFAEANTSIGSNPRSFVLDPSRSILQASPLYASPFGRRPKFSSSRHPLANDNTDIFQDDDDMGEEEEEEEEHYIGIVYRMRLWRHDALMQHLYETAAFWGDKIVSWTNDPNDAFWLAQTYFLTHQYSRAERLLTRPFSTKPPPQSYQQSGINGAASTVPKSKGKEKEIPFPVPPPNAPIMERLPIGPSEQIEVAARFQDGVSRLVDMSVACRYLCAQCQVRQGKWNEATEMLGEANPFRELVRGGPDAPNIDGGIKIEASMCHLRGLLMLKLNRGDQAKACFMEALVLDVKCFEAFQQLVDGQMMSPDEEWEFVQGLAYKEQTPEDADFMRIMYTSRLRKLKHAEEHTLARTRLVDEYGLGDNPDVLYSFADALYTNFRFADCFTVTSRILGLVTVHAPSLPLHLACMHHLSHLNSKLFILAHDLVEREPENPISWYAVGVWYLSSGKWTEARTYFSKTSLMDPRFAPAWIAFAHSFAHEGEHDHAITAYSTCTRLFTGSHLPLMFVGMEHISLSNLQMADESFTAANMICDADPLLANEQGVLAFNRGEIGRAVSLFQRALELAKIVQTSQRAWTNTYLNLGTAYRKLASELADQDSSPKHLQAAKAAYSEVVKMDPRNQTALAFLGVTYHLLGDVDGAIVKYHETLSIDPINGPVLELLDMALDASAAAGPFNGKGVPGGEEVWAQKMREHRDRDKGKEIITRDYPQPKDTDEMSVE